MWVKTQGRILWVLTSISLVLVWYYALHGDKIRTKHPRKFKNVSNRTPTEEQNRQLKTTTKTQQSNKQNIPFSPFLEICSNMTWRPDLILPSSSSWEPIVPRQSYVYSVFVDKRKTFKEIKAITSFAARNIQNISIFCQIWSENEKHPMVVKPTFSKVSVGNIVSR